MPKNKTPQTQPCDRASQAPRASLVLPRARGQGPGAWSSLGRTCRLFSGSVFMTEPAVLRGREISTVWVGLSGAWTWSGAAGARPKLGREKPRGDGGEQALTQGRQAPGDPGPGSSRGEGSPASQPHPRPEGQAPDPTPRLQWPRRWKRTWASQNPSLLPLLLWGRHRAGPGQCVLPCPPGAPCHTRGLKAASNLRTVTAHVSVTNPSLPGGTRPSQGRHWVYCLGQNWLDHTMATELPESPASW